MDNHLGFDNAFVINLDHREDRLKAITIELAKHGIVAERIPAIKGNPRRLHVEGLPADVGCTLSHVKCIEVAKERGYKSVLIFEDDAVLRDNFTSLFKDYWSRVPEDWDMVYLGGNHWGRHLEMKDNPRLDKVADNVYRTLHTLTTHAYVIKDTIYDKVIEYLGVANKPVDMMYVDLQQTCKVYALRPNLAWQKADISDINNKSCDYVYFLKDW